jgi:hypothetical protein
MGPKGARNQERLCRRDPEALTGLECVRNGGNKGIEG